jgi:hypothetical protein
MSDQKLIDLSAAGTLDGTELLYMVQAGNDVKVTAQAVANLAAGGGAVDSVNGQTGVVSLDTDDIPEGTAKYNVQADWSAGSGLAAILNKPTLATVATTGSYNDLSDKPSIPSGTVTSVAMTVPTGLSVSGSPITGSGTFGVTLASGYVIPLQTALDAKAPLASPTFTGTVTLPAGQVVNGVTLTTGGGTTNFLRADGTYAAPTASVAWGGITGTLSSQTDLNTALGGKQDTLVSGTNIKTVNSTSLLGSGNIVISGSSEPVYFIMQAADRTLTSTTAAQQIFDQTTNGAVTLPTGRYSFECGLYLTGMSGTSGNAQFRLLGGGTATVDGVFYAVSGLDNNSPLNAGARGGSVSVTVNSVASMITLATGTGMTAQISGTFDVTVTGTLIPSIALVTAAAATLKANSYFRCQKIADTGVMASAGWS